MLRVTTRSIWEHKRRLVSTVLAIVLGTAFMSGTFVLADTLDKVFDDLFSEVNENVDVQVQGVELFDGGFGGGPDARELLDPALVDAVRAVEGIERAEPFVQTVGFGSVNRILDDEGDPIGATQGPPTLIESWIDDDVLSPYRLVGDGRAPTADDEIALNVAAAEDGGWQLGDPVRVLTQFGEQTYTLVGTFTFGTAESSAGAVSADFTLAEARRLAGLDRGIQVILAGGADGADQVALRDAVADVLPPEAEALTGEEAAAQTSESVQEGFSFFQQLLVIFGAVALLVGTFIIANTFSILIAQRTRELALLRAIGATRRQVLGSVLLEASVIGLVSAVLGLLGGVALAAGVTALFQASGADLPTTTLVVSSSNVIRATVIGLVVTLVASILPAVQATRVPPIAALRDVAVERSGASRIRIGAGVVLLVGGVLGLSSAWTAERGSDALPGVGLGALLLIVGAIVVGPVLARPTIRVLGGWLPRVRGITGQLATENAARSPKRTSATASALVIGVTLVGFITIFAASAEASIESEITRGFSGDLVVQSESGGFGFGPPGVFPATVADDVAAVDGVDVVSRIGFTTAQITFADGDTSTTFVQSIDPATATVGFDAQMAEGDVTDLTPGGVLVDQETATNNDLAIGDMVGITGPTGSRIDVTVQGISDDFTVLGFFTIDTEDLARLVSERQLAQLIVVLDDGADLDATEAAIEEAISGVPGLEVLDRDGFVGSLVGQITSFLTLVQALLGLSIIIAVIGIANTLSLSIHERTRELGLLRAVGMTRSQLRSAIRWEAVLISVLGTVVGLGLSLLLSYALVSALDSFGLTTFRIPFGSLLIAVVGAASLGVLAAIRPARRAARLDILDAIATE